MTGTSGSHTLKEAYASGATCVMSFVNIPSPATVEIVAQLGADVVVLDAEHGPMGLETIEHMVRAAEAVGAATLVRLPFPEPRLVNRALDTGATGVLVPHIDSREVAEAVVLASKYRPRGGRGAGAVSRAGRFGVWRQDEPYEAWANAHTMVFGILEDAHVVDVLPEILDVDGIDGFTVGHSDLSHSLGVPGELDHPAVNHVLDRITDAVLDSDKMLCRVVRGDEEQAMNDIRAFLDRGVRMVGIPFASLLSWSSRRVDEAVGRIER